MDAHETPTATNEEAGQSRYEHLTEQAILNPEAVYRVLFYIAGLFFFGVVLLPFYFLALIAITPEQGLADLGYVPTEVALQNFVETLQLVPIHHYIFNSIVIAGLATTVVLSIASLAGYVFGRLEFPGRNFLLFLFLTITYFPGTTFIIPLFRLFTGSVETLGIAPPDLFNTPWPVVLPMSGLTLPLAIFILTVFYSQIPDGLEDAARIEGCTRLGALVRVIMPLSAPGVATAGILTFIVVYNDFFFSFLLTDGQPENWAPLVYGILGYQGTVIRGDPYHLMAAGSILGLLPVAILVFIGQKKIISGLTAGALKE